MENIIKITSICIIASVFSLILRKNNPEVSFLLGLSVALFCLFVVLQMYQNIKNQISHLHYLSDIFGKYFIPLIKCFGISVVTQLGIGLCKDSGFTAAATGLDLCGSAATILCVLPLINHLFSMVEDML